MSSNGTFNEADAKGFESLESPDGVKEELRALYGENKRITDAVRKIFPLFERSGRKNN